MSNKFVRFKTNRDFSRVLSSGYTELSREIRRVLADTGVGATATWGSVTGTLSSQTDLYTDLTSHSSRHLPTGTDALATAAPLANLTAVSTNNEGTANSFSRSDHSHAIDVASVVTSGLLTSTDWNTFNSKQAVLVSGTNIKTVNGNSLLGAGNLVISASSLLNYIEAAINYNILTSDDVVNITVEDVIVTLPSAISLQGKKISIKSSVNTCTINTSLSQTVDGETSIIISRKWTSVSLVSTGTNWIII